MFHSLKKLRTSYIDILYVHLWDWTTSIEEIMDGLHNLVVAGKVLYLVRTSLLNNPSAFCKTEMFSTYVKGISDSPAWVVSAANQYAKDHGKSPFVVYQGLWNIMERSFERDIIPMARQLGPFSLHSLYSADTHTCFIGLALAPFMVLAGGKLRSDAEEDRRRKTGENGRIALGPWERTEDEKRVSHALEKVAK